MAGKAQAAKRNIGGGTWRDSASSNVAKEAKERKEGGAVEEKKDGGEVVSFKRKDGGEVTFKKGGTAKRKYGGRSVGKPEGKMAGGRLDKRARGGGIRKLATGGGSDKNPFSSAGSGSRHAKGGAVKSK